MMHSQNKIVYIITSFLSPLFFSGSLIAYINLKIIME